MGLLSTYRDNRAQRRAHTAALKSKAKLEAKLAAKETRAKAREAHQIAVATAKDQSKQARQAARTEAKNLKSSAKAAAKKADRAARKGAAASARRSAQDAKAAAAARKRESKAAATHAKQAAKIEKAGRQHERAMAEIELAKIEAGKFGQKDVKRWIDIAKTATPVLVPLIYKGVTATQGRISGSIPASAGPAAALTARIESIRAAADSLADKRGSDASVSSFVVSTNTRLDDLDDAVSAAEAMPTSQRREILASISTELDRVNRDVLARLGVTA